MEKCRAELHQLGTVLGSSSKYEAFSHRVDKPSMEALALSDRVEAAAPLRCEIRGLPARRAVSLPQDVVEQMAPCVSQLQERFKVVNNIIGQAIGTLLSLLVIPPSGPIERTKTDAVKSRIECAIEAGDTEKAIVEMEGFLALPCRFIRCGSLSRSRDGQSNRQPR
ncbi:hypothetical protein PsorP6_009874 [Peronosclerospora sorghi]|uniref:Uncharacterized protein n=1 Tax=Peronosclerospora sorghi TaxID=230839 RepID=A0ACC0VZ49_9STRA|nr:hypothetical protein PsorP6_009874 [Peronosclerospora sorghi]